MTNSKHKEVLEQPALWISDQQRRWLRPGGLFRRFAYSLLYVINWVVVRCLFRITVVGLENLPASRPFILTPNHSSAFDPPILAASFPLAMLQETFWAAKQSTVLRTRMRRLMSWLTRVIPIGDDVSALAAGATVLQQANNLVWFPEGKRSLDGQLHKFKPGIGMLLSHCHVPVVPVFVEGAYDAFPTGARVPRFRSKVVVRIGTPLEPAEPGANTTDVNDIASLVDIIRLRVLELKAKT